MATAIPDRRGKSGTRQGGVYGDDDDGKIECKSCHKGVFAPQGFDLALVDCPHCRKPMG